MPLTVALDAAAAEHGGKAATLGHLRRAGLPVPDGFVVPAEVPDDAVPAAVEGGLAGPAEADDGAPMAVRSSATDEDGANASAAGQYDTVLGATGPDAVAAAVRTCRASASGPRAVVYRAATGHGAGPVAVCVLVQRLVDARAAGVLFTDDDGRTVIEASWGLGESVVQGAVDPDRFAVDGGGITHRRTGVKRTRANRAPGGTTTRDVPVADRARPCIDDATVLRLAGLGTQVAALLGGPQDVEWAIDDDGELWLLQARPVTAPLPHRRCGDEDGQNAGGDSDDLRTHGERVVLSGVTGSGGRAQGPARVVRGLDDFDTVRPGDVLVCAETDPAWTPLFGVVAAVVTETGGLLSHAAIVARELGLPAVLGVPGARRHLREAGDVVVDGGAGTVALDAPC